MLTLIFIILMFMVFGNMFGFAFKATWGLLKVFLLLVLLPVFLIVTVIIGLIYIALPILIIVGIVSAFRKLIRS